MSPELIGIIIAAVSIVAIIVPGQRSLRSEMHAEMHELRRDIAGLGDRMSRLETHLTERIARLEGLFEGFTKKEKIAS